MLTASENGAVITVTYNGKTAQTAAITVQQKQSVFDYDMWYWTLMMLYNQQFDITAMATDGGTITPAGISMVKYSKNLIYTITPDDGHAIADVIVDGESIGAVSVTSSITCGKIIKLRRFSRNFRGRSLIPTYRNTIGSMRMLSLSAKTIS